MVFYIHIPHENLIDPIVFFYFFFLCPSYAQLLSYGLFKTKFENRVCEILPNVF